MRNQGQTEIRVKKIDNRGKVKLKFTYDIDFPAGTMDRINE